MRINVEGGRFEIVMMKVKVIFCMRWIEFIKFKNVMLFVKIF